MDRRRDRGRANSQRADDLDSMNDLKFNVDFESRTISRNKDWNGRTSLHPPPPYSMGGYDEEDLGPFREHVRGGSHHGLQSGPGMTSNRMAETDEGDMNEIVDVFAGMGMDPRRHSTPGGPQGRKGIGRRHVGDIDDSEEEDMDPHRPSTRSGPHRREDIILRHAGGMVDSEEEDMDPHRPSTRSGPHGRGGMERRHVGDMNGFDNQDIESHRPSTRSGPHGREGMERRHVGGMDDSEEEDMDPYRPSTRSGPHGRGGMERRHLENMDSFDDEDIDRRPSMRSGNRGPEPKHMGEPSIRMTPTAPGGSRVPGSQPTKPKSSLRELEAELDKVEGEKERAMRMANKSRGSSKQGPDMIKAEKLVFRIMEIKNEIYKIDPQSKRIDNAARFFLHLPPKGSGDQELGGPRPGRRGHVPQGPAPRDPAPRGSVPRGPAPRGGGNHGGQRDRPRYARDDRY